MISTWGRSRRHITTHAAHLTLKHTGLCGRSADQKLDGQKYPTLVTCKLCLRALRKIEQENASASAALIEKVDKDPELREIAEWFIDR